MEQQLHKKKVLGAEFKCADWARAGDPADGIKLTVVECTTTLP